MATRAKKRARLRRMNDVGNDPSLRIIILTATL
jgi:hypothetical protein